MATNWLGIDLGNTMLQAQRINKGRREEEEAAAAQEREAQLAPLRAQAAQGDENALRQMAGMGAGDDAKQILDMIGTMDKQQRDRLKDENEKAGKMLAYVQQSQNPEETYLQVRAMISPEAAESIPPEYNPHWVGMKLAQASTLDQMLSAPDKVTFGDQDILFKQGQEVGRATSQGERNRQTSEANALRTDARIREGWNRADARKMMGSGGAGGGPGLQGVANADENTIYKQVAQAFGGNYNPVTGTFSGLNKQQAAQVQAAADAAVSMYSEGGASRTNAVTQALRLSGAPVADLRRRQRGGEKNEEGDVTDPSDIMKLVDQYAK